MDPNPNPYKAGKKVSEIVYSDLIPPTLLLKNHIELEENLSFANEPTIKYESVRVFTTEEQQKIDIALKQLENGEVISDEEAQIELEKWFEEQEKQFGQ